MTIDELIKWLEMGNTRPSELPYVEAIRTILELHRETEERQRTMRRMYALPEETETDE